MTTLLLANFGADEALPGQGAQPTPARRAAPVLRDLARHWRALYSGDARVLDDGDAGRDAADGDADGAGRDDAARPGDIDTARTGDDDVAQGSAPAWPFLDTGAGLVPWLSTRAAEGRAAQLGVPYRGAPPDVVTRVHDKAWAARTAAALGLVPAPLRGLSTVLDDVTPAAVQAVVGAWPAWARRSFTLKPRWGTSGRGRVAGHDVVDAAVAAGCAKLQLRGGCVVEPWLTRTVDLSALWYAGDGAPLLLGTTTQLVSASGVWQGNQVVVAEGRARSGHPRDAVLIAATRALVEAAAEEGFTGPCGVDAFVFVDDDGVEHLRPVVELNARFTSGIVAVGLAHQRGEPGTYTFTPGGGLTP